MNYSGDATFEDKINSVENLFRLVCDINIDVDVFLNLLDEDVLEILCNNAFDSYLPIKDFYFKEPNLPSHALVSFLHPCCAFLQTLSQGVIDFTHDKFPPEKWLEQRESPGPKIKGKIIEHLYVNEKIPYLKFGGDDREFFDYFMIKYPVEHNLFNLGLGCTYIYRFRNIFGHRNKIDKYTRRLKKNPVFYSYYIRKLLYLKENNIKDRFFNPGGSLNWKSVGPIWEFPNFQINFLKDFHSTEKSLYINLIKKCFLEFYKIYDSK